MDGRGGRANSGKCELSRGDGTANGGDGEPGSTEELLLFTKGVMVRTANPGARKLLWGDRMTVRTANSEVDKVLRGDRVRNSEDSESASARMKCHGCPDDGRGYGELRRMRTAMGLSER